ncbi:hypothetical protein J437_LFUL002231 [Ladona fulva]|uniref:Uncharacterized protein n=1 Tax=Ladona fulva TaxID=123851 RepID=A0A8K0JYU8_LADFU|nr:hypothetical protein J437_LFUL002231 [Ladona fulva]
MQKRKQEVVPDTEPTALGSKKLNQEKPSSRFDYTLRLVDQALEPWLKIRLQQPMPDNLNKIIRNCLKMNPEEEYQELKKNIHQEKGNIALIATTQKNAYPRWFVQVSVCGDHHKKFDESSFKV